MKTFMVYSDAGHGWIRVPNSIIDELGIRNDITYFSYESDNRKWAYLEEDCDAGTFIKAYKAKYGEFNQKVIYSEYSSIRKLGSFVTTWKSKYDRGLVL